nr:flagellar hook-basal body protein [Massilia sp. BJB1822]
MAVAADGLQKDTLKMRAISQNLANALTPAYKKQFFISQAFAQQFDQARAGLAPAAASAINPRSGTLRPTGNVQDVAIEGEGYFVVSTAEGPRYTRQGALHVDDQGRLAGPQGLPLHGPGGEISLANAPFKVLPNGEVWQNGALAARLRLVHFENPSELEPLGGGLYAQGGARASDSAVSARIKAGYLENSNVNTAEEMVALTETVRHFEALTKLIQGYDDNMEKAIRKLGEF